ncbi:MAG: S9 family peptidase [Nitrososphaerales archaeon]|jgi:dipeptidyl aminopeptidase/acylaminoacyl peptidase
MSRGIKPEDLAVFRTISRPSISPRGGTIAVSVKQADIEEDAYKSDVWLVSGSGKTRKFTNTGKDSSPVWSPDGKSLLFSSKRGLGKEEKGSELYTIAADGGEARLVTKRKEGIEGYEWAPNSRTVFFRSPVVEEEKTDVRIIRRLDVWSNGRGFVYNLRRHVFKADGAREAEQVTSGEFDVTGFAVSHNGKKLAYAASGQELKPYIEDLFVKDLGTGRTIKLTRGNLGITSMAWGPDDAFIAFAGSNYPRGFASHDKIWVVGADGTSRPRLIDRADRNKANSLNTDVRAGAHGPSDLVWEGRWIYHLQQDGGGAHLRRTDLEGRSEEVLGGDRSIEGYDVKKGKVAFVAMDGSSPEELYLKDGAEATLTSFNREARSRLSSIAPKPFSFKASDRATIEGWVLLPDGQGNHPAVLYVHGGPKTAFGHAYSHELQTYAAAGYAVVCLNPRGSDGYSERFADIRGAYGTRDFEDLMEGLDFAVEHFPIDGKRVAIAGGSYGGFMTNWALGHTDRFKAGVTDRSISNWFSMFGCSDIGIWFTKDQTKADPWANEERLMAASPLRYAEKIRTPLLIVHSFEDYRCPLPDALQLFSALKYFGRHPLMVLFPGENHDLSRTGKPKHRVERLDHYIRWFDAHLKPQRRASKRAPLRRGKK